MSYRVTNAFDSKPVMRAGPAGEDGEEAVFATLDAACHEAKAISKVVIGRFAVRDGDRIRAIAVLGTVCFADKCTGCKGAGKVVEKSPGNVGGMGWFGASTMVTCNRCIGLGVVDGLPA